MGSYHTLITCTALFDFVPRSHSGCLFSNFVSGAFCSSLCNSMGQRLSLQANESSVNDAYATSALALFEWDRHQKYHQSLDLFSVKLGWYVYCPKAWETINTMVTHVRELLDAAAVPLTSDNCFRIDIHIQTKLEWPRTYDELVASRDLSNMMLTVFCNSAHQLTRPDEYAEVNKDPSVLCIDFDWPQPNTTNWKRLRAMILVRVLQLLDRERNSWEQ